MTIPTTIKDISNNVVVFPKTKDGSQPHSVEELRNRIISSKMEIAEVLAEEITKENIRVMIDNGYYISNAKDIAFLMTTIKSILLRYDQIDYPIQTIIDEQLEFVKAEDITYEE